MFTVLSDDNQSLYHTDKEPTAGNYVHGKQTIGMYWDGSRMVSQLDRVVDKNKKKAVRRERDRLLSDSDWRVTRSQETGIAMSAEWVAYRQALRDITAQDGFPYTIVWPEKP